MITKLSDLMASTDSSTTSDSDADDSSGARSPLDEAIARLEDEYGVDVNRETLQSYLDDTGTDDQQVVDYINALVEHEDLFELAEQYRRLRDQNRIRKKYLYDLTGDYTTWAGTLYGDGDNPEPGTYNYVQQEFRAQDGNLLYHSRLFPEPVERFWSDEAVLWAERPNEDTHIYVSTEFVNEYADFAKEVDGEVRPVPPSNDEIQAMQRGGSSSSTGASGGSSGDTLPFKPPELTNDEIAAAVEDVDDIDVLQDCLHVEKKIRNRKGAKNAIRDRIDELELQQEEADSSGGDHPNYTCGDCGTGFHEMQEILDHDC